MTIHRHTGLSHITALFPWQPEDLPFARDFGKQVPIHSYANEWQAFHPLSISSLFMFALQTIMKK